MVNDLKTRSSVARTDKQTAQDDDCNLHCDGADWARAALDTPSLLSRGAVLEGDFPEGDPALASSTTAPRPSAAPSQVRASPLAPASLPRALPDPRLL